MCTIQVCSQGDVHRSVRHACFQDKHGCLAVSIKLFVIMDVVVATVSTLESTSRSSQGDVHRSARHASFQDKHGCLGASIKLFAIMDVAVVTASTLGSTSRSSHIQSYKMLVDSSCRCQSDSSSRRSDDLVCLEP